MLVEIEFSSVMFQERVGCEYSRTNTDRLMITRKSNSDGCGLGEPLTQC